jgi:hypothetical protein
MHYIAEVYSKLNEGDWIVANDIANIDYGQVYMSNYHGKYPDRLCISWQTIFFAFDEQLTDNIQSFKTKEEAIVEYNRRIKENPSLALEARVE